MTRKGEVVYSFNGEKFFNGAVQKTLDNNKIQNNFGRQCAEVNAISKAVNKGYDLTGATIAVVNVRGLNSAGGMHGVPEPPCVVCAALIVSYKCCTYNFKMERKKEYVRYFKN